MMPHMPTAGSFACGVAGKHPMVLRKVMKAEFVNLNTRGRKRARNGWSERRLHRRAVTSVSLAPTHYMDGFSYESAVPRSGYLQPAYEHPVIKDPRVSLILDWVRKR